MKRPPAGTVYTETREEPEGTWIAFDSRLDIRVTHPPARYRPPWRLRLGAFLRLLSRPGRIIGEWRI